jgi:hypothetical protein
MEKRSHLGMAGHYAAMAEFLYRGYNVAVPAVDIGDDAYVVEDQLGTMWRLQVKTTDQPEDRVATYLLSRQQLRHVKENELFFMFMARRQLRWRFILISRGQLAEIRDTFEVADRAGRRGRRPASDADAKTDALALRIEWSDADARGWGISFARYLDCWPSVFSENANTHWTLKPADQ